MLKDDLIKSGVPADRIINMRYTSEDFDDGMTGSNSKRMSSEISAYLTGRYISISVFTLSFAKYMTFKKSSGTAR